MIMESNTYVATGLFGTCGLMLLGLFSTYSAVKAYEKGRNFLRWYLFSLLFFPVAFIASFVIKNKQENLK
ncbi:MAG: hypothetical protein WCI30_05750 [Clostridia bacterium]